MRGLVLCGAHVKINLMLCTQKPMKDWDTYQNELCAIDMRKSCECVKLWNMDRALFALPSFLLFFFSSTLMEVLRVILRSLLDKWWWTRDPLVLLFDHFFCCHLGDGQADWKFKREISLVFSRTPEPFITWKWSSSIQLFPQTIGETAIIHFLCFSSVYSADETHIPLCMR